MEDDDEIQSHPSPASRSPPASPDNHSNGRITVTVAAVPAASLPPTPQNNTLTLALPIQQQPPRNGGGGGGGGGGREDCWSEGATAVLIEAWGDRYLELSRGNLKQKHWKEVAEIVSGREDYGKTPKTDIQCKNRIDTVKKKYKSEKSKIAAGGGPSKWPFYDRLDHLIGPTTAKISPTTTAAAGISNPHPNLHHQKTVPVGIPAGIRSISHYHHSPMAQKLHNPNPNPKQKIQIRRSRPDSDSSPDNSPDSTDSFPPPEPYKRPKLEVNSISGARRFVGGGLGGGGGGGGPEKAVSGKDWGNSVRELTRAILKFGEAYEQAESSKLQQVVEMEKQRMKFAKELELQRMQFFMKTQLEISQLKHGRRVGNNNSKNHSNNNNNIKNSNSNNNIKNSNNNNNNNNNSDSSN